MYAIFQSGGKQHRVSEGQTLRLEKLDAETGATVDFDSVLMAASILDHMIFSFAHEFLPFANQKEVATIGMKVFALGKLSDKWETALRYTLSLPISTTIVGCSTLEELNKDIDLAENFVPMTDQEKLAAFKEIMDKVKPANMAWKADGWVDPSKWWNE